MNIFSKKNRRKLSKNAGRTQKQFRRITTKIFKPFKSGGKWLSKKLSEWWKGQKLKNFLFGIPALAFLATCVWGYAQHKGTPLLERANTYLRAGEKAFQKEQWETASLYLSRAIEMGVNEPTSRFKLAQAAEKIHDRARMVAILEELAPEDRAVHAPAHLWKAVRHLTQETPRAEEVNLAIEQLELALALEPLNRVAHGLLGDIQFQLGQWASAVEHLEISSPELPQNSLKLAQALLKTNQQTKASTWAKKAETQARKSLRLNSQDTSTELALASSLIIQERFTDAEAVILQALNRLPDNLEVHAELARTYLAWTDWIRAQSPLPADAGPKCLQLLCAAVQHDPNNFVLFDRLLALMLDGDRTLKAEGVEMLLGNISRGVAAGMNHLILGTFLDSQKESEEAAFHLTRAFELMDNTAIVANNLAWNLARGTKADLDRADRLIDRVLKENPDVPAFRETRGQIRVKQNRYKEALNDLEFALPHFPRNIETHDALVKIYSELGLSKLATRHQQIADQLQNR